MEDATLSSEDEEFENPIETAVKGGVSLVEPERTSISLFCCDWLLSCTLMLITKQLLLKLDNAVLFYQLYTMFEQLFGIFISNFLGFSEQNLEMPTPHPPPPKKKLFS